MRDYSWVEEIALESKNYSGSLGAYFAKAVSKVAFDPVLDREKKRAWLTLTRDLVHYGLDPDYQVPSDLAATVDALELIGVDKFNQSPIKEEKLAPVLTRFFERAFDAVGQHPEVFDYLEDADLLQDIAGTVARRVLPFVRLFPAFSAEAQHLLPHLREPLFTALYELPEYEHHELTHLTEKIMRRFYAREVRPPLAELLRQNVKGRNLLLPLIDEAVNHLPADRCMTSLIAILCTPRAELGQGRIISIVLQELGGMYVKLAQVLAELAPPSLARELRHQQDKLGGIFGSTGKSWAYVLEVFERPAWERLRRYLHVPEEPQNAFAGASVGAIYEFALTELGQRKLQTTRPVLLKIQRPGLIDLFEAQKETLLAILNHLEARLEDTELSPDEQLEVRGLVTALKRTIINYALQSVGELDFRIEKRNAELVREALRGKFDLSIPQYYHVETDVSMMEKIEGEKITAVVHSRYLERMSIADTVSDAYLYLMFQEGIIWADPHAGNILYDPDRHQVKLIDLNPCFSWDPRTIKLFIGFLYRLILSDQRGIFDSLRELVENPAELKNERTQKLIRNFVATGNQGAFIRYLSDFVRLLGDANINLKIEVQAALRGITQVYLTASAVSSRHNFGQIFQKQFGWRMLVRHILLIGPLKVARAALPIAFDLVKNSPEQEVGPTLDERDITAIEEALVLLNGENVCNIELQRTSPEDNMRLSLSTDGSRLIRSANLRLEILTETKPASVRYVLELPTKEWLRDRQEYVKLQGMGFALCTVECLEQLRRHSLENYWYVVEGWNKPARARTYKESTLIGDVRLAARNLFAQRFDRIWESEFMTVSRWHRFLWKLLIRFEERFEKRETGYFYFLSKKVGNEKVGAYTFGSLHRIKLITDRLVIQGIKTLIKRSRFEMNLLPLTTDQLVDRMIHGLLRRGFTHRGPRR
jgi:ubiquinone biosynthesis protein